MADAIAEGADSRGMDAKSVSFYDVDMDELKKADAIALGSSTFWYTMHQAMDNFINKLSQEKPKARVGAAFGSYGWSGEAPIQIAEKLRAMGMHVVDPVLRMQYTPTEKDLEECKRLGKDIANYTKKMLKEQTISA
jgi:flavorubredoxin